jgi:hypothetical protein
MRVQKFSKRFWLDVLDKTGEAGAFALDMIAKVIIAGLVGGALVTFSPLVFDAPSVLGHVFATWCAARAACDLNTNLVGLGLGIYIVFVIGLFVWGAFNFNPQSLDEDVLDTIKRAGDKGITAAKISRLTDIERGDVEGIITNLLDEGEVVISGDATPPITYRAQVSPP